MPEIEAKFLVHRPEQVDQVLFALRETGYTVAENRPSTHVDVYYDTRDRAITKAGWAFRCRQGDGATTLALKSLAGQHGAVFVREEVEQVLPDGSTSIRRKLPPGPVQEELEHVVDGKPRHDLFSVTCRRSSFDIRVPDSESTRLELDLDRARIYARKPGSRETVQLAFTELELELMSGNTESLVELARVLREQVGLVPARLSKFERGEYLAGLSDAHDETSEPRLRGNDPVIELLYRYLRRQLRELRRHEATAWEGLDPEGVHKMRVAIRRIRTMLRSFGDMLAAEAGEGLDAELKWLAEQLGKARDADICEIKTGRLTANSPGAEAYADHLRQSAAGAYENLVDVMSGERYAHLSERLERFILSGPCDRLGELSISRYADKHIREATRKVLERGNRIDVDSPARELHQLRKRTKRLRYVLELFSEVQTRKWAALLALLERLQDLLGTHQDAVTAAAQLAAYAESLPSANADREHLLAVGRMMQIEDDRIASCRRRFPALWARFRKTID